MPIESPFPPALLMLAGALLLPLLPRNFRSFVSLLPPLLSLYLIWTMPAGGHFTLKLMDYRLLLCNVDELSRGFGIAFAFITFAGCLFAFHVKERGQQTAVLLYAAGALGVTFAGDYISLFIFWELMALTSTFLIWTGNTPESERAGMRYLIVHILGSGLLFAGILAHTEETGRIVIERLAGAGGLSSWLIFAGLAVNAAIVPLHAWLPDAYPKASTTGAVFLSALTTKTAVYVLLRIFPGLEILIPLGVLMALYGVFYAVMANDIREILAYHIVSQLGYMIAGAGIGTPLAINGAAALAFSNILYKTLLFMGTGAVIHATGKSKLTELGGLAGKQPLLLWLYMIGAFAISGFPLLNGFASKSMVVAAAGEAHHYTVMLLLLLASIGTFLSVGLKLPYFTWYGRQSGPAPRPAPLNMYLAMAAVALVCFLHGLMPGLLYDMLPHRVAFEPYTYPHLVETAQILIFSFAAFWMLRKKIAGEAKISLDFDWFYRKPAKLARRIFLEDLEEVFNRAESATLKAARKLALFGRNPAALFAGSPGKSDFSPDRNRPATGTMLLLVIFSFVLISLWGLWGG